MNGIILVEFRERRKNHSLETVVETLLEATKLCVVTLSF